MERPGMLWPLQAGLCLLALTLWVFFRRKVRTKGLKPYTALPGPPEYPLIKNLYVFIGWKKAIIHRLWTDLALQYGPLYRFRVPGKDFVVVSDQRLLPAILGRPGLPKSKLYKLTNPLFGPYGHDSTFSMMSAEDPIWQSARKTFAPCASGEAARKLYPMIYAKSLEAAAAFAARGGDQPLDVQDGGKRLALDIITLAAYGLDPHALNFEECAILDGIEHVIEEIYRNLAQPWRRWLHAAFPGWGPAVRARAGSAELYKVWGSFVERMKAGQPYEASDISFMAQLSRQRNPATGEVYGWEHMVTHASSVVVAGMDTTGHAISWALFCVAAYKGVQERLASELADAGLLSSAEVPEPRPLEYADLTRLPYLMMVIKESMRMFPVAGSGIGRVADRDLDLGGFHIPAGTEVAVCLHTLHNVPWNFPDPGRFWPERWAEDKPGAAGAPTTSGREGPSMTSSMRLLATREGAPDQKCFLPFSGGPRGCLGQRIAMVEMTTILATLVGRLHCELAPCMGGAEGVMERQYTSFTLAVHGGLWMTFRRRAELPAGGLAAPAPPPTHRIIVNAYGSPPTAA